MFIFPQAKLDDDDVLGSLMQELDTPSAKVSRKDGFVNNVRVEKSKAE